LFTFDHATAAAESTPAPAIEDRQLNLMPDSFADLLAFEKCVIDLAATIKTSYKSGTTKVSKTSTAVLKVQGVPK